MHEMATQRLKSDLVKSVEEVHDLSCERILDQMTSVHIRWKEDMNRLDGKCQLTRDRWLAG